MKDNGTIEVEERFNYGSSTLYPANDTALLFCELLGTKTLPLDKLKVAVKLGFRVAVKHRSAAIAAIEQALIEARRQGEPGIERSDNV